MLHTTHAMLTISDYIIRKSLNEGDSSLVFRAQRKADKRPVILKILKEEYPSPERIAQFKREYQIAHSLNPGSEAGETSTGVVATYNIEKYMTGFMIVMEDFGGESLDRWIKNARMNLQKIDMANFLHIAIHVTEAIAYIHKRKVIHKNINPSNIIFKTTTGQVKLIDFRISTLLSKEKPHFGNPNILEGTLAYLSPEQTGRINRTVDFRTDFYSLGATFYELLTLQLPFSTTDTLELVHCHIAKQPASITEIRQDVPQVISDIVLKLLSKDANDRYQSAQGLLTDLEKCLQQEKTTGDIQPFPLGQQDISELFQIPQKLYGRDREIESLLAAFERSSAGKSEMMLVSGYAGIGKTALVQEIFKPVTRRRGYFISGKFDQYRTNIPYSALLQAFQILIQHLLTENEAHIRNWREKLRVALGPNGGVILEVLPNLELIIGPQPQIPSLGSEEAQNLFRLVFQNFVRVFAQPEHPLVIFLDDLQWADAASLNLIKLLMTSPDSRFLFFIAAYRDNEISDSHPLIPTVDKIMQSGLSVSTITLRPLDLPDVLCLIADTMRCSSDYAEPLAQLLLTKTGGNPFFMIEFLKSMYDEGFVIFDFQKGWHWELERIQSSIITDNVVDLIAGKTQILNSETQQALKMAACIGSMFDLNTLAIVQNKSPGETASDLWPALSAGLILPLSDTYKLVTQHVEGLNKNITVEYKFAHDRVRQAVYSLISPEERKSSHYQIGQLLLTNTPIHERESRIFDIVNQLNQGHELIKDQTVCNELSELNLLAGKKAKTSTAYEGAFRYLKTGIELLGKDRWDTQYDLTLELYVEAAETSYLSGDFGATKILSEEVLKHARTLIDKVKIYEVNIQACIAQNNHTEAVEIALSIVKLLGERIPPKPTKIHVLLGLIRTKFALAGKQIDDLIDLPTMTDPHKLAAMRILAKIGSASYIAAPNLMPLVAFRGVNLSIKHGTAPESIFAYVSYGVILCGVTGDFDSGYRFGRLALNLVERLNARELKSKTLFAFNGFIRHWKESIQATLPPLLEGYQTGLETGDLEFAARCIHAYCSRSFFVGRQLEEVERDMIKYSEVVHKLKQVSPLRFFDPFFDVVRKLTGKVETPIIMEGKSLNDKHMLSDQSKDRVLVFYICLCKLILSYLFEQFHQAVKDADDAEINLGGALASIHEPYLCLYSSLSRLAVYNTSTIMEQKRIQKIIATNQKKLSKWARYAPTNNLHKFYLVEAERSRVLNRYRDAEIYYDKALSFAQENAYLNDEALVNELLGKFYIERGQLKIAQIYLQDARYAYHHWGAFAKVKDMDKRYNNVLTRTKIDSFTQTITPVTTRSILQHDTSALDLMSVIKASQAISGEIVLSRLLTMLMSILIENAGAQRGFMVLKKNGRWIIEEEGAASIINYVARTQETVILHDATNSGPFILDPYIVARQPKSIICLPLLHHGDLCGILYLENNLTANAFTPERLEVLRLLSGQIAISLINARLYDEMELRVQERTVELSKTNIHLKQEITERKKAQETLKESQQQFADIINFLPDATFVIDKEGTVIAWNQAIEEMTGVKAEEILGKGNYEYSLPFYGIRRPVLVDLFFSSDISIENKYIYIKKEDDVLFTEMNVPLKGKNRVLWAKARPLYDSSGNIAGAIESVRDITERKKMEAELIQAKDLAEKAHHTAEAANLAKSTFLANMSHEIRTPLNSIIGFTNLTVETATSDRQRDFLQKILISSQNLLGIINDILDFSKIEAGKLDFDHVSFELNSIMDHLYSMFSENAAKKGVKFTVLLADEVPLSLLGDPLRLTQVLINLVSNAIKFTETGEVTITVGLKHTDSKSARLRFSVSDTGIGIAQDALSKIFDIFTQADGSMTRRFGGTGLGLSICQRLVEMMGGEIHVESTIGKGSTFSFTAEFKLSLNNEHEIKKDITETDFIKIFKDAHILLVEDNVINQQVAKEILEGASFAVEIANNGSEALEALSARDYDAVLMDVQMPVMSGYEVARQIRRNPRHMKLPIIAMTAHVMQEASEESLAAGMNGYITKPIDRKELFSVLSRWVKPGVQQMNAGALMSHDAKKDHGVETILSGVLHGIDVTAGLKRLGGNSKVFARILNVFSRDYANATEEIKTALDRCDTEQAVHLTHTIKGIAGNISAKYLHAAASRLEKGIRQENPDELEALLEIFDQSLKQVLNSIKSLESPFPDQPTNTFGKTLNLEGAYESFVKLEELVSQLEKDSMPLWEITKQRMILDEISSFGQHVKSQGEKYNIKLLEKYGDDLIEHVLSFDFENIKRQLNSFPELVEHIKSL